MSFRQEFLARFTWVGGHADVLGLLADPAFLGAASDALAEPFRGSGITKVAGVEARGFVFGVAVALKLSAGFVPMRKPGSIHPGPKSTRHAARDWRGNRHEFSVQRPALSASDVVLVVDDWVETGSQALAARGLVEDCGARYAGLSVLVDQTDEQRRAQLAPVRAVVRYGDLPPPD